MEKHRDLEGGRRRVNGKTPRYGRRTGKGDGSCHHHGHQHGLKTRIPELVPIASKPIAIGSEGTLDTNGQRAQGYKNACVLSMKCQMARRIYALLAVFPLELKKRTYIYAQLPIALVQIPGATRAIAPPRIYRKWLNIAQAPQK